VLSEFMAQIGKQLDAPPPAAIQVECSPRLELDRAGRTLTIGLGLISGLTVQQLAGLIATQLAQHRRGAVSGPTNLIRAINGWMWRSVFQQDRFEQWITRVNLRPGFHLGRLVLPLRYLSFLARAALWIPMFIGNTVAAALVRQIELDADVCAARLVGKQAFLDSLQRAKIVDYTWEGILAEISFLYKEQRLPDSLPHELAARLREMTPELCSTLVQTVIVAEEIPFDSRPNEADRLAAVAAEPATGAIACPVPARGLWTDFGKMARDASFDYYSAAFGAQHIKAALRQVE
jgi:Zn-dependent protease with chaperone function